MEQNLIHIANVSKTYRVKKQKTLALKNINIDICKGSITGIIGPNGAGKSTLIKLLCGILKADSGIIQVMNRDPYRYRKEMILNMGVMFGNRDTLYINLPAIESIYFIRDLYNIEKKDFEIRMKKFCDILQVGDLLDKRIKQMSLGQKIRIELLTTLLPNPELLLLDEPTLGLDIISKNSFRRILIDLAKKNNTTILLTTHDLEDVEKICTKVVVINRGQKIIDDEKEKFDEKIRKICVLKTNTERIFEINENPTFKRFIRECTQFYYKFVVPIGNKYEFTTELKKRGIDFILEKPSLEDIVYDSYL